MIRTMLRKSPARSLALFSTTLLCILAPGHAGAEGRARENVAVRAESAWEDPDGGAIHLLGHVEVVAERWQLAADGAVLHGDFDDPDRVLAEGNPARFRFTPRAGKGPKHVDAEARRLEYRNAPQRLALSGGAVLRRDGDVLEVGEIEYWRATDEFRTGGTDRVRMSFSRAVRPSAASVRPEPPP